jgi:KDO2-lipid IV(A) lauroyltransferase
MARKASVQDVCGYLTVRALMGLLGVLPERLAYWLVDRAGRVFFRFSKKRRRIALENLRLAMGPGPSDRSLLKIASQATANLFKTIVDLARLGRWRRTGRLDERVDTSGLRPALERGGEAGFILISPHIGSWELGLAAIPRTGLKISVITRKIQNPLIDKHIHRFRSDHGIEVYPRRGGMRHAVRALRKGRCLIALPDQNQRSRGIFVPFFGRLASTERSIASLSVRMEVPVIATSIIREGRSFRFTEAKVIDVPRSGELAKDIEDLTVVINQAMEKLILDHPEQYFWIHDRYRTRPPEERKWMNEAPPLPSV